MIHEGRKLRLADASHTVIANSQKTSYSKRNLAENTTTPSRKDSINRAHRFSPRRHQEEKYQDSAKEFAPGSFSGVPNELQL